MIDDLARTAVDDMRAATTSDVEAGLLAVYAGHHQRRRETVWAAAAAVVLALGLGWWGGHAMTGRAPTAPQPVTPPGVAHIQGCWGWSTASVPCCIDSTSPVP